MSGKVPAERRSSVEKDRDPHEVSSAATPPDVTLHDGQTLDTLTRTSCSTSQKP